MADTTDTPAAGMATAAALDTSGDANLKPAKTVDAAGAPQQIVPDVDLSHPAVDDNPRAGTTVDMNRIDFNDPAKSGAEAVAEALGMTTEPALEAVAAKK